MTDWRSLPARFGVACGLLLILGSFFAGYAVTSSAEAAGIANARQMGMWVIVFVMIVPDFVYRAAFARGDVRQKLSVAGSGPRLKFPIWMLGVLFLLAVVSVVARG